MTEWPLAPHLVWTLGGGIYDLDALFGRSYRYWGSGLGWARDGWAVDLSLMGTSGAARELFGDEVTGRRFSLTVTRQMRFGR